MVMDPALDPAIERIIDGRSRDLGGFTVRRVLPAGGRRMVGPFIFFDHLGPADFAPGHGIDVRPHPHIGLATVTYLFDGELLHRDSLGHVQPIRPGDVNWMTAGRGIAHSERTDPAVRARRSSIHGLQSWVALPRASEEVEPSFFHHPADTLPSLEHEGVWLRIIAGTAFGKRAPVATCSETLYVHAQMPRDCALSVPMEHRDRAIYVVDGSVTIVTVGTPGFAGNARTTVEAGRMAVLVEGAQVLVRAASDACVMLLGGEPLDGERHIWWNFVSSSQARIEQARAAWKAQRFAPVPGETEFIPLPDR
jgi:redox-sensitive bicupin YhaK (pirin superfamily)